MIASKIDRQVIKISLTFTSLPRFKQQKILNCRRHSTYQSLLTNKFDSFQHQDIRITSMLDLLVQGFISKVFWIGKKVLGRNLYEGFALLIMPAFCRASETSQEQKKVSPFLTYELRRYIGSNLYFLPIASRMNCWTLAS